MGRGRSRVIGNHIAVAPLARETSLSLCNPMMNAARSISGQEKRSCFPDTPMTKEHSQSFGCPRAEACLPFATQPFSNGQFLYGFAGDQSLANHVDIHPLITRLAIVLKHLSFLVRASRPLCKISCRYEISLFILPNLSSWLTDSPVRNAHILGVWLRRVIDYRLVPTFRIVNGTDYGFSAQPPH
jgi:hypothetical protein